MTALWSEAPSSSTDPPLDRSVRGATMLLPVEIARRLDDCTSASFTLICGDVICAGGDIAGTDLPEPDSFFFNFFCDSKTFRSFATLLFC